MVFWLRDRVKKKREIEEREGKRKKRRKKEERKEERKEGSKERKGQKKKECSPVLAPALFQILGCPESLAAHMPELHVGTFYRPCPGTKFLFLYTNQLSCRVHSSSPSGNEWKDFASLLHKINLNRHLQIKRMHLTKSLAHL